MIKILVLALYYFILLTLVMYTVKEYKDILHPIFISGIIWIFLPTLYEIFCLFNSSMVQLSSKFYLCVLCYFIPLFVLCNLSNNRIRQKKVLYDLVSENEDIQYTVSQNIKLINFFVKLEIILNFLLIYKLFSFTGTFNYKEAIIIFRWYQVYHPEAFTGAIKYLRYAFSFTAPTLCYIYLYHSKHKKIETVTLILQTAIILPIYASKGFIMKYFLIVVVLLYLNKKLNIRSLLVLILLGLGGIYALSMIRDSSFLSELTYLDYIFTYLLSPLPAFDKLINGEIYLSDMPFGSRSWAFLYRVSNRLFHTPLPPKDSAVINYVKLVAPSGSIIETNVYTGMGKHYMDFGIAGIIFYGALFGLVLGFIYRGFASDKLNFLQIAYILILYCVFFQFFGDEFFGFLSMPLQDLLCAFFICNKFRIRSQNYTLKF